MSWPRERYDELASAASDGLVPFLAFRALVDRADPREEGLHVDAKRYPSDEASRKRIFAKCISAFANAAGGLILWGVDWPDGARATVTEPLLGVGPIDDARRFARWLNEMAKEATWPSAPRVESLAVAPAPGTSSAYVVTYVAESDLQPHMVSGFGGDEANRYFRRLSDRTAKMDHFMLRDAFGKRDGPLLIPRVVCTVGTKDFVRLVVSLHNRGRGLAREYGCRFSIPARARELVQQFNSVHPEEIRKNPNVPADGDRQDEFYVAAGGPPLWSLGDREIAKLSMVREHVLRRAPDEPTPLLELAWTTFANDMRTQRGCFVIMISTDDFRNQSSSAKSVSWSGEVGGLGPDGAYRAVQVRVTQDALPPA